MPTNKKNIPFLLLTASLFTFLLILPLVRRGMFLDGVTYAAIAKNLAMNIGTLWAPHWSQTSASIFYEHPPFAIYMESFFFRVFGQAFWVEKSYSFAMAFINILATLLLWGNITKTNRFSYEVWIPLMLWLLIPINVWCYKNNMLECTATCFSTLSLASLLIAQTQKQIVMIFLLCLAVLLMFLGFLSNGPASLFPLAMPIIYWIVYRSSFRTAAWQTCFLVFLLLCSFGLLFLISPAAMQNIKSYLITQLVPDVIGQRTLEYTDWKHLNVLVMILNIVWPILLFGSIVLYLQYTNQYRLKPWVATNFLERDKRKFYLLIFLKYNWQFFLYLKNQLKNRNFIFYFMIGLSASLPVGLSHKQTSYYLLQSCPFYLLAVGVVIYEPLRQWVGAINFQSLVYRACLTLSGSLLIVLLLATFLLRGTIGRDKELIVDVDQIAAVVPKGTVISTTKTLATDWDAVAYFERFAGIHLEADGHRQYFISYKNDQQKLAGYKIETLPTKLFTLYVSTNSKVANTMEKG